MKAQSPARKFLLRCLSVLLALSLSSYSLASAPSKGAKQIVFIASDLRNESVGILFRAFKDASVLLGWSVKMVNGEGDAKKLEAATTQAIQSGVDGVVLGGFQIDTFKSLEREAKLRSVILVGWHSAVEPGPQGYLFANITTAPEKVAALAYQYVTDHAKGRSGIIIINDSQFAVANKKTKILVSLFKGCESCDVLAVENIPISNASRLMPSFIQKWNRAYGKRWTHTVAINDSYFDHANFPLSDLKRRDVVNVSAGDGSLTALSRIRSGLSQHKAVVAEPIREQGWQLVHELQFAFAGKPWSGRVTLPKLISAESMKNGEGAALKEEKAYETYFKSIWFQNNNIVVPFP